MERMENIRFSSIRRPRSFRAQFVRRFVHEDALSTRCGSLWRRARDEAREAKRETTWSGEERWRRGMLARDSWQPVAKGHARSSRRSCTHRLVVGGYRDVLILPRVPRGEIDTHRDPFPFPSLPLTPSLSVPSPSRSLPRVFARDGLGTHRSQSANSSEIKKKKGGKKT